MKKGTVAALGTILGGAIGVAAQHMKTKKRLNADIELGRKNEEIIKAYSQWMKIKKEGRSLADYLKENGYQKIAVYGMHYLGENLCEELEDTDIEIKYAIDKNADNMGFDDKNIIVYTPDEELEEVDAVIVTAFYFYDEIEEKLSERLDCPIVSLEDILYELSY